MNQIFYKLKGLYTVGRYYVKSFLKKSWNYIGFLTKKALIIMGIVIPLAALCFLLVCIVLAPFAGIIWILKQFLGIFV